MKRIVLFSTPTENENLNEILKFIFPNSVKNKSPLFMPSQGLHKTPQKYIDEWQNYTSKFDLKLEIIDNSILNATSEIDKLNNSNILIISGGDPFQLLINLRMSGLDNAILQFAEMEEFIIAGYSAGAYVLTPSLEIPKFFIENYPEEKKYTSHNQIKDFRGLGIIGFEIFAHYSEIHHKDILENYIIRTGKKVKTISDNEYIIIDL
jgi:peptidase E